jgi:hypothetical protein
VAGNALHLDHDNNGGTILITVNLTGLSNATLSWATKIDSRGHDEDTLEYSIDGSSFQTVDTVLAPSTTFSAVTYNLPAAVNGIANVELRYTLNGATANDGTYLDNVQVKGVSAVPEASAAWFGSLVCGVVGIGFCGRSLGRKRGATGRSDGITE